MWKSLSEFWLNIMHAYQISRALMHWLIYHKRGIAIPNTMMRLGESDMILITKSGYVYEFEIKVSRSDFFADFRKMFATRPTSVTKHDVLAGRHRPKSLAGLPKMFYFCVPSGLVKPDEVPPHAGLIEFAADAYGRAAIKSHRDGPKLQADKIDPKFLATVGTRLSFKLYNAMGRNPAAVDNRETVDTSAASAQE